MPSPRTSFWSVAVLAAIVLVPNLGAAPLWDEDEPLNASCTLAMLATGDWVVPTFNGRLRIEKPPLVNWLQLAGFATAGVNERGARLGSAILTIGTCLLTWDIARRLFDPVVAGWSGVVMATCLWTGITGRAATPDAPLGFLTTLALATFVRGLTHRGVHDETARLPRYAAIGAGLAAGAAMLAKGPVGIVLPLAAFTLFAWWKAIPCATAGRGLGPWIAAGRTAWRDARLTTIAITALLVALPWYTAVGVRTDGEWLRGFLLVHNVGRFAAPMEGHSGSMLLYYPAVLLLGTFPWSCGWIPAARHAWRLGGGAGPFASGTQLLTAWLVAWIVPFSIAGTKLPGYVWPAYPALACFTGLFLASWVRRVDVAADRWMRIAWICLATTGAALVVALPSVAHRMMPVETSLHAPWLGLIGCLPMAGAAAGWACQNRGARWPAAAIWAATGTATVACLVGVAPAVTGWHAGARHLLAALAADHATPVLLYRTPPSAVFYAGRLATRGRVPEARSPERLADLLAEHAGAHVLLDARFENQIRPCLPHDYRVLRSAAVPPSGRQLLLIGPAPVHPRSVLAARAPP